MPALLRQGVYARLAGYEDVNNAERLRIDPAMPRVVGGRAKEKEAASTSEMSRFETEILISRENPAALIGLSGTWIDRVREYVPWSLDTNAILVSRAPQVVLWWIA